MNSYKCEGLYCDNYVPFGFGPLCEKCNKVKMEGGIMKDEHASDCKCARCQIGGLEAKTVNETLEEIDNDFRCETFAPLPETGTRDNAGKPQLSMILEAGHALNGCAAVLEMGANKYSRGNWRKGLKHTEIIDSLLRHLTEHMSGRLFDEESELPHVDHILCNALFLAEMFRTNPELGEGVANENN